nr:sperm motility kinase 1-like [Meriones unguiculatus]
MPLPNKESPYHYFQPRPAEEESFRSQYEVLGTIGRGSNAKVKLAHHRLTGTPVAIKVLLKKKQWCELLTSEVDILMMANHPNIVSLLQVIESEKRIYLIMELVEGQQLYHYIQESGHLQEDEAREIFRQIIAAVSYCHKQGIIHRDLKPDNILLDSNGKVKIIDFGLSTQVRPGQKLSRHCGAYPYGAPEFFLGKLYDGSKTDMWSLGVVLYFMVVGTVPFDAVTIPELQKQVVSGKYAVPSALSEDLQDLISLLLTVNPKLRPRVSKVMTHPWLRKDMEEFPNHCKEMIPSLPDSAIVEAMQHIGFQAQDIKESLQQRKYNQTMACYSLLQEQAQQGHGCPARARRMNPGVTPFPSLEDPAAFSLAPRRRRSEPTLSTLWSFSNDQVSAYGQKAGQRGSRRAAEPGTHLFRPLQESPSLDQVHQRSRSAPCIYFTSSESTEDKKCSPNALTEGKSVPSQGQYRGLKGWARRIRNSVMKLCCCFSSGKKPHQEQNRVYPQK